MHYQNVRAAKFIDRPNRFIAHVELDGSVETVHVKNTGRCRELLVPGCTVYLEKGTNPNRKTAYDLIAVEKGSSLINMDAQAPNKVFAECGRRPEVSCRTSPPSARSMLTAGPGWTFASRRRDGFIWWR